MDQFSQVLDGEAVRGWLPWSQRRYTPGAWPVVEQAARFGEPREEVVDHGIVVRAVPIPGPDGETFGVRVWQHRHAPEQDPPQAGGFTWNEAARVFHQSFACANMSGTTYEEFIADRPTVDFTRRALRFDYVAELVDILHTQTSGKRFSHPVTVVHIQTGEIMAWQMILEAGGDCVRGFFYDMTPLGAVPDLPSPSEFAQRYIASAEGRGLALGVRLEDGGLVIGTWLTDPPTGVSVDRISGDGHYLVTDDSSRRLAAARLGESVEVHIRLTDGGWGAAQASVLPYMHGSQPDQTLLVVDFRLP
ncbi:GAF domain-containing protein [Tsukamurella tyrosinosolvens]|uniref:GAF domain-containing protein n=1 Tax=Tsukamurella tyrosinosolvens TaxID=57704 RepID=UPI001114DF2F|nr:GAF domain-containing protein [Tsukamurella tyrosinosolvens]